MKLMLDEVKPEDLVPGQDYLLFHAYPPEQGGGEWIFGIWKNGGGWAFNDAPDALPDWPTQIFESPDARKVVDSE